ncbi:MAG: rRNA maturation RNase YbeY [bacterium]|nr:rRNA maturation RNase YbeY [bacterium]
MITVLITSDPRYPINKERIREQVEKTLVEMRVVGDVEVSITVVGDRKMKELNSKFRQIDDTTDVLSFPLEESDSNESGFLNFPTNVLYLGDIVLSYPQAIVNASTYNRLVDDEINTLVEHSILHLLGIHHEGD